jgi:hypothetical protein
MKIRKFTLKDAAWWITLVPPDGDVFPRWALLTECPEPLFFNTEEEAKVAKSVLAEMLVEAANIGLLQGLDDATDQMEKAMAAIRNAGSKIDSPVEEVA